MDAFTRVEKLEMQESTTSSEVECAGATALRTTTTTTTRREAVVVEETEGVFLTINSPYYSGCVH